MSPYIDFEITWEDDSEDLIQMKVHAQNIEFCGTAEVYTSRCDIRLLADQLKSFPEPNNLEIKFEAEDPHLGTLHLRFFCRDFAHHISIVVEIVRNSQTSVRPSDHAQFVVDLEGGAALDNFRDSLYSISNKAKNHARIVGVAF